MISARCAGCRIDYVPTRLRRAGECIYEKMVGGSVPSITPTNEPDRDRAASLYQHPWVGNHDYYDLSSGPGTQIDRRPPSGC
jgi:hypothetical protein